VPITPNDPFHGRHYEGEVILCCVRWYLDFPLSDRNVAKLMRERGLAIHPSCVFRWVQLYGPELNKRCRPYLRPTNKSYRVDETYVKVKGALKYLYRAVDSTGHTIDFCSQQNAMPRRPNASFDRYLRRQVIRPRASST
jgi:transposase, IS6 family